MCDDEKCALTGRRCWRQDQQEEACADVPTIEDAVRCIEALDDQNEELHHEIDAMDQWIEKLRSQAKQLQDKKPENTRQ